MSYNHNHRNLEHAINLRRNPATAAALQKAFDIKRLARVEKSIATRPVYIPFKVRLDAAGQISPYQVESPDLPYDTIVTGIITDNSSRQLIIRESFRDPVPVVIVGRKRNLYLDFSDIAGGTSQAAKGRKGAFYLPSPITIEAGNRLYFDVYKTEATADPELLNFVLIGHRVSRKYSIDDEMKTLVKQAISRRAYGKTVFLKQQFDFDSAAAGGKAKNVYTEQCDEPLFIRGCRSTLRHSLISIGIEGEPEWTTDDAPIWALAAEDDNEQDSYVWFQRDVFLPAEAVLEMELENSIGGNIDPQFKNQITWICETM